MRSPWLPVEPLGDADFAALRRRTIFDCHKWDPQVGDACVVARHPLLIRREDWLDVIGLASSLARETLAMEAELVRRPGLHRRLGLPRAIRRAVSTAAARPAVGVARIIRFDFHYTSEGWRISEANVDVPGGLNEASGFPPLVSTYYPHTIALGDPAGAYADALAQRAGEGGTIALVHATAYSDDQQMMAYVAKRLVERGVRAVLASPAHLRWSAGRAFVEVSGTPVPADVLVRFFPAEWLPALPKSCGWIQLFGGSLTPQSNPATALLVQSKRLPLVWNGLETQAPTWRRLLPETRDPRDVSWQKDDAWLVKPALGRVGEGVGIRGLVEPRDWKWIRRGAAFWPGSWIAQRRFDIVPVDVGGTRAYPCLGVYTVDAKVVGAYGRLAARPLIDALAKDAAVLTRDAA